MIGSYTIGVENKIQITPIVESILSLKRRYHI